MNVFLYSFVHQPINITCTEHLDADFSLTEAVCLNQRFFGHGRAPYVVMGSGGAETKTLTIPADPVWAPGSRYRYTLTLGTADVTLDIDVVEWDEENYSVRW